MSSRGSITIGELQGKLTMLEVACHRCERRGGVSLARRIEAHGADMGLPYLWESLAGDCPNAHTTALHSRCAIYYPRAGAVSAGQGNLTPDWARLLRWSRFLPSCVIDCAIAILP